MATCIQFDANGFAVLAAGEPSTCTAVLLSGTEYQHYQDLYLSSNQPFDYVQASAIFSFFFSFVVGCFYISKNAGMILQAIKRF